MPTPTRIEKLTLCRFRGATCPVELTFDTSKPAVLIFGENGTGKSTLVDALDFVCNGEYGSLSDRSSTTPKSHLPALGSRPKDVAVSINYGGQSWTARLATSGPETSGPKGCPRAQILRRSQVLRVVNEQPKKRYEALQSFITVPHIEACEQSLRKAVDSARNNVDEAVRAKTQAEEALERLWRDEGSPARDSLAWARSKAAEDPALLKTNTTALNSVLTELTGCIEARSNLTTAVSTHSENEAKRQDAQSRLAAAQSNEAKTVDPLITLLQDALVFLKQNSVATSCPVCEQSILATQLEQRLSARLEAMKELVALKATADGCKTKAETSQTLLRQRRSDFVLKVRKLASLVQRASVQEIASLGLDWAGFVQLVDTSGDPTETPVLQQATACLAIVEAARLRLTARRDADQKILNQLNAIRGHVATITEKTRSAGDLDLLSKRLAAFLAVVEKHRKAYVEGVLATISGIVEDLYVRIHPGEDIGRVRLYLKPKVIGSLEFDGQFQSEIDVPPQAYYSESHLDTLGVCVFLALAKHFNESNTVVVLDDVVTSVDDVHMERFMRVLHDEAAGFNQLIITTHYRAWRDRYRFSRGPSANVQLIELLHWSLPRGVRHTKTKLSINELRGLAKSEPLERQVVASKAGILLEGILDHLALLYRTKLPRQAEPNYTLGDLSASIGVKLSAALRSERVMATAASASTVELQPLLNDIAELAWIRNQVGCHFSLAGMSVGDPEVTLLAQRTIRLAEALVCSACGELPWRNKSGSFWECRCGQARLHPLVAPGERLT